MTPHQVRKTCFSPVSVDTIPWEQRKLGSCDKEVITNYFKNISRNFYKLFVSGNLGNYTQVLFQGLEKRTGHLRNHVKGARIINERERGKKGGRTGKIMSKRLNSEMKILPSSPTWIFRAQVKKFSRQFILNMAE